MKEKLDKYWSKMEDFAALNLVFNPRFKLELLEFTLMDELSPSEAVATLNRIKSTVVQCFNELNSCQTQLDQNRRSDKPNDSLSTNQISSVENKDQDKLQFKQYLAGKKNNNGAPSSSTAELDMYLQEATIAVDSPLFDIFNWWKVNSLRFPTLAVLAKTILMVPMTSISSESAFSMSGRILSDYQSRLKPDTLEALVCGQDWICTNEGLYSDEEALSQ
jgi:hypothetical protein